MVLILPDTSPRGAGIEGEDDSWDFGTGAGFYLDATQEKWSKHYNMYSYVVEELYELVLANFPVDQNKISIMGHSMGGHGALTIGLKNPGKYKSASAFAPICNPIKCPWGLKAFSNYLGDDKSEWEQYDTLKLIENRGITLPIYCDTGDADGFYKNEPKQLLTHVLDAHKGATLFSNIREGYDHSYYFISTFVGDHFEFHSKYLAMTD